MVKIENDRYVIEVETGCAAHEDYAATMYQLVEAMQYQNDDIQEKNYYLLELLKQMLPTADQAKALFEEIKDTEPEDAEPEESEEPHQVSAEKRNKPLLYVV